MDKHEDACVCADCHRKRIEDTCATLRAENARLKAKLRKCGQDDDLGPFKPYIERVEAKNARLSDVARVFVRQVEEFETWDADDWPVALDALKKHASAARRALGEG